MHEKKKRVQKRKLTGLQLESERVMTDDERESGEERLKPKSTREQSRYVCRRRRKNSNRKGGSECRKKKRWLERKKKKRRGRSIVGLDEPQTLTLTKERKPSSKRKSLKRTR
jgi:hypothetical protein